MYQHRSQNGQVVLTTRSYGAICDLAADLEQWLLGDSSCPLRRYNSAHCKTRVNILFGIWKSRFRCLTRRGSMMFRPEGCIVVIVATSISRNRPILCRDCRPYLPDDAERVDETRTRATTVTKKTIMTSIGRITPMTALSQYIIV